MSYSAYFKSAAWQFPTGFAFLVGSLTYINCFTKPIFGFKEISGAEFKATPNAYLHHPEHHRTMLPKVPGQSKVELPPSPHHHH